MTRSLAKRLARPLGAVALIGGLLAPLASLGPSSESAEAQTTERPNFLFILTDDLDQVTMDVRLNPDAATRFPNVQNRVRAASTEFRNANAVSPVCCPDRASILTGRYIHNHGVYSNSVKG